MSTVPKPTDYSSLGERSEERSPSEDGAVSLPQPVSTEPGFVVEKAPLPLQDFNVPVEKRYRWNRRYSRPERFVDIWSFFLSLLGKRWLYGKAWSYTGGLTADKQASRRRAQAQWIRHTCLNLGPTFIKLGQLFSTRSDLFPAEYVEELSKLQDQVPAFSYEQV